MMSLLCRRSLPGRMIRGYRTCFKGETHPVNRRQGFWSTGLCTWAKDTRSDFSTISFFSPAANFQGSFQPGKAKRGEFDRMFCHRPTRSNPHQPYPWRISRWNPGTKSRYHGRKFERGAHSIRMSLLSLLSTNRRTMGKGRLEISGRLENQYSRLWPGIPLRP